MIEAGFQFALSPRSLLASGLSCSMGLAACAGVGRRASALKESTAADLDRGFTALRERHQVPGLAAGILLDGRLAWAKGYGFADIENRRPMTADTVQNVGSVTKTLTTTLALQDIEAGRLDLDGDINRYLRFSVRNPNHPNVPITLRQLLTHRSSIRDGIAYSDSYRCGDQTVSLEDWLQAYFAPSAKSDHFHVWAPGTLNPPASPRAYSNVAFGLIGLLSERVGGKPYADLCRQRIFDPLGMTSSGIRLDEIDRRREAVPYKALADNFTPADISEPEKQLARYPEGSFTPHAGGHFPFCRYSFATAPDGLLRTSVTDLARFISAWIGNGVIPGRETTRIVSAGNVAMALGAPSYERPLGWNSVRRHFGDNAPISGSVLFGHNGSDPGIGAVTVFRPEDRSGFVMIFNTFFSDAIADDGLGLYLSVVKHSGASSVV